MTRRDWLGVLVGLGLGIGSRGRRQRHSRRPVHRKIEPLVLTDANGGSA